MLVDNRGCWVVLVDNRGRYEILQLLQNENENAATKHTVVSPNSMTAKRQLIY